MAKRRSFQRLLGERRYKKLFIIAVEGSKTEPQYFAIFNEPGAIVSVKCLKGKITNSAPLQVLKKMEIYLQKEGLKKSDEAWLVVDKDAWPENQLKQLMAWEQKKENYGFALSNPNFEYWLLLHFEDSKGSLSANECLNRLKKHLPNYHKEIDVKRITRDHIDQAILRAKLQKADNVGVLSQVCSTTVYRLVERILGHL